MSSTTNAVSETLYPEVCEPIPAQSVEAADAYGEAEELMRNGRRLVVAGFVVAVIGIVVYCVVCLSATVSPDLGDSAGGMVWPSLGIIGLGTLLWLVGSFNFLRGAMDSDPDGPDINF